jgi:hypothetical protein
MKLNDLLDRLGRVAAAVVEVDAQHVAAATETLEIVARAYGVMPPSTSAIALGTEPSSCASDAN